MKAVERFNEGLAKIKASGTPFKSFDGLSDSFIDRTEHRLAVQLPPSYRNYLLELGYLVFCGEEFYGEKERTDYGGGLPSFVWATEDAFKRGEIGEDEVIIKSSGDGSKFLIDLKQVDSFGEGSVFLVTPQFDEVTEKVRYSKQKIYDNFGEFFLNEIEMILEG